MFASAFCLCSLNTKSFSGLIPVSTWMLHTFSKFRTKVHAFLSHTSVEESEVNVTRGEIAIICLHQWKMMPSCSFVCTCQFVYICEVMGCYQLARGDSREHLQVVENMSLYHIWIQHFCSQKLKCALNCLSSLQSGNSSDYYIWIKASSLVTQPRSSHFSVISFSDCCSTRPTRWK